jgi:uncharacterized protein (TIGR02145 family)
MKSERILVIVLVLTSLIGCKTEQIILHGEIAGSVTDASTTLPLQAAIVKLVESKDSTSTGSDGKYLLKNLTPGVYSLQAIKSGYGNSTTNVKVESAKTETFDLPLTPVAVMAPSDTLLDFGFDSTYLHFTISNKGKSACNYVLTSPHNWITINPSSGHLDENGIDSITVTVNRTGLSESTIKDSIKISTVISQGQVPDIYMAVYVNDLLDNRDNKHKYYQVVQIGTQTWMAENLDVGTMINSTMDQTDTVNIEKYCYGNSENMCNVYGGYYQWNEMMKYKASDTATIGTTQGICPVGWHIPTSVEYSTLGNYLGTNAGGKLKAKDPSWQPPNAGATNESGFSALPAGWRQVDGTFVFESQLAMFWGSTQSSLPTWSSCFILGNADAYALNNSNIKTAGQSVRCVKDPAK